MKRASSDDALTKPALGAASGSRMKKTVTTGAISDLLEARPRSLSGRGLPVLSDIFNDLILETWFDVKMPKIGKSVAMLTHYGCDSYLCQS